MKLTSRPIFVGAFVLLFASAVAAQQKTVTWAEIEQLEADAGAKLEKLSYREKNSVLSYRDDRQPPYYTSTTTTEYLRPNRERTVYEKKDEEGVSRSETIDIGKKRYSRKGNGKWKVAKKSYPAPISMISMGSADESNVTVKYEYLYLGEQNLNGHVADHYQVTTTRILRDPRGNIVNPSSKKYWFDKKGRLLKTQIDTTNNHARNLDQEITEYEYDIPITINAPIK